MTDHLILLDKVLLTLDSQNVKKYIMWYVYILIGKNGFMYTGSTHNVYKRLGQHNNGLSKSTTKYRPFRLHSYFALKDKDTAIIFEKYLKTGSGKAFLAKRILLLTKPWRTKL